ncbi:MAG TPA: hypothetical protein VI485_25345 [Vicinamibacterales bacterium]|nr:hypothetical protein [Vicinamibacterales bacterium]
MGQVARRFVLLFCVVTIGPSYAAEAQAPVNAAAAAMAAFQKRVDAYLQVRSAIAHKLPEVKETGDPAKISNREKVLGQAIAMARASAKAGDVFGEMAPYLHNILAKDWASRSPAEQKALFAELPAGVQLKVNQPYPTTIPLVNAPANLLAQLPTLPEALEYRLVNRRLLLRDRDANVIVDVLTGTPPNK